MKIVARVGCSSITWELWSSPHSVVFPTRTATFTSRSGSIESMQRRSYVIATKLRNPLWEDVGTPVFDY